MPYGDPAGYLPSVVRARKRSNRTSARPMMPAIPRPPKVSPSTGGTRSGPPYSGMGLIPIGKKRNSTPLKRFRVKARRTA